MAFWCRINQSRLQLISNQYRRFYFQTPYASSIDPIRTSVLGKPVSSIDGRPSYFYGNVRFFAAPVQGKYNNKEEPSKFEKRLNEQIKADVIRLVTEEGHEIIPIHEALRRAKVLDLDLVEVQKSANPPVCKLMDYNQERYKRRVMEKDRAKSKSGKALKKGECKEIRFTGKIEAKDIKMKADSVIRLMERGYRVKCMAMGKGKEDEDEDLGGLLSRLTDLIQDVSVVESGPRVERKQAYVVVRHVKFGPLKKGGGKTSKVVEDTKAERKPMVPEDDSIESISESENEILSDEDDLPRSSPMQMQGKNFEDKKTAWSVSESGDDFDKLFNLNGGFSSNSTSKGIHAAQHTVNSSRNDFASKFLHPKPVANSTEYSHPDTSLGTENRYRKSEPRNQFPPARSMGHMGQNTRESGRSEPRFSYQRQQAPQNMNASSSLGETKQVGNDASLVRNLRPQTNDLPKQRPSHSDVPGTPAPSFGIFSTPTANSSGKQGIGAEVHGSKEGNRYASLRNCGLGGNGATPNFPGSKFNGSQRPNGDMGGKDRFGIFNSDNSTSNRMPKSN
ncbi:PREDICTED: uncharacterized protein LOC18607515 [Theobroma cacao]|uniref:Uncharacterized protein LOC18607515 n=1 Tax=Theobroma cacao TaxID=3641 RepID=A0AB32VGI0_THECC|nr:PREDICTED: uncharacterized protein LOC18607515 [Theobroma cacao]